MPDDGARLPRRPDIDWTAIEANRRAPPKRSIAIVRGERKEVDWVDLIARLIVLSRRWDAFTRQVTLRVGRYEGSR